MPFLLGATSCTRRIGAFPESGDEYNSPLPDEVSIITQSVLFQKPRRLRVAEVFSLNAARPGGVFV